MKRICVQLGVLFAVALLVQSTVTAQWVQTNGPYGGGVQCLTVSGTNLFAGTGGGVFLSTNNGSSWTEANNGLTGSTILSLAVGGTNIFAGVGGWGVFLSTNDGASWSDTSPIDHSNISNNVFSIALIGGNLFAGGSEGVSLSTNNGTNWTKVNTGLTNTSVLALAISGTNLFAGTLGGGVFLSINNGTSWTAVNTGLTGDGLKVQFLVASGTNLFAGTYGGVFLSTNNGTNWTAVNSGLTGIPFALAVSGTNLFGGTTSGVFLSTNNGTSWTAANSGLTNTEIRALAVSGSNLFAGSGGDGVYLSTNNGTSWTAVNTGMTNTGVSAFAVRSTNLFAGTGGGGVFLSTNNGNSWIAVNTGLTNVDIRSLAVRGSNLFAGTTGGGVFLSTDNGTSWTAVNTGLSSNAYVWSLAVSGTNLLAGTYTGVFISTNDGFNWTQIITGLTNTTVYSLAASGSNLLAGTAGGVFLSTNNGANWTAVNTGLTNNTVTSLAVSDTNLFAATYGGVFLSTNNGTNWTAVNTGLTNNTVNSLAVSPNGLGGANLFAGTNGGVFLSTNNGTNWIAVNSGLTNTTVMSFAVSGTNLFAGTGGKGVFVASVASLVAVIPPLSPQGLTVADSSFLSFTLKWRKNTDADFLRYRIYRGTSSNPTTKVDSTTGGIGDTSKIFTGLTIGTRYYFRVTAVDSSLSESGYSNQISAIPFSVVTASYNTKTITFGSVKQNQFKDSTVIITNTGNDTLRISNITFNAGEYSARPKIKNVPPGQSFSDTIRFAPFGLGEISAKMFVSSNASTVTDTLAVSGFGANYAVSLNWTTAFFGEVPVGQSKDTTVVVTNTGNDTLRVTSIVSSNPAFSSRRSAFNLAPNESLADTVRFVPAKIGVDSARVVVTSNSPTSPDTILVFGTGVAPTGVAQLKGIPTVYSLAQNYPNPFNPSTTITFGLPSQSFVSLKVFDLIGREVATLVSEELTAGYHSRNWNAESVSGGVYFYRIQALQKDGGQAGNFVETKKLLLVK